MKKLSIIEFEELLGDNWNCLWQLLLYRAKGNFKCLTRECSGNILLHYKPVYARNCFRCKICQRQHYPLVGTIMENSHKEVKLWFTVAFALLRNRNGISSSQLCRDFENGTPRTFRRMANLIRKQMGNAIAFDFLGTGNPVEVDESYITSGTKGLGRHFPFAAGRGSERNSTFLVVKERNGRALCIAVDAVDDTINDYIKSKVGKQRKLFTDEFPTYKSLKEQGYDYHRQVKHRQQFMNGEVGTQSVEGFNSQLKNTLKRTYKRISEPNLPLIYNEESFRQSFKNDYDYGLQTFLQSFPPFKR